MMSQKLQDAMNKQVNAELYSAYLYLSMAAWLDGKNFKGASNWMNIQAQEELGHAMKFVHFLQERGAKVVYSQIAAPQTDWETLVHVFEDTCKHEALVTSYINDLVDLALSDKDHASSNFLQWFVDEQVEEEATAQEILEKVKMVGESGAALFMIDKELSQRTAPPATSNTAE
jgi:ferritin